MGYRIIVSDKIMGSLMPHTALPALSKSHAFVCSQHANAPHRVGNMVAMMLEKNLVNTDRVFGFAVDSRLAKTETFEQRSPDATIYGATQ